MCTGPWCLHPLIQVHGWHLLKVERVVVYDDSISWFDFILSVFLVVKFWICCCFFRDEHVPRCPRYFSGNSVIFHEVEGGRLSLCHMEREILNSHYAWKSELEGSVPVPAKQITHMMVDIFGHLCTHPVYFIVSVSGVSVVLLQWPTYYVVYTIRNSFFKTKADILTILLKWIFLIFTLTMNRARNYKELLYYSSMRDFVKHGIFFYHATFQNVWQNILQSYLLDLIQDHFVFVVH